MQICVRRPLEDGEAGIEGRFAAAYNALHAEPSIGPSVKSCPLFAAVVVLLSACGVTREPPPSPQQMVVLVGAVDIFGRVHTLGSGFVLRRAKHHYVVTSRHAIAEGSQKGVQEWFALPKPRKTKNLKETARLSLGQPMFHARDSDERTYDVAVLSVLEEDSPTRQPMLREIAMDVEHLAAEKLADGQAVTALGYPAAYADPELSRNVADRLFPLECHGRISYDSRALSSPQSGFTAPLVDFHFAITNEPCLGEGASGGVVVTGPDTIPRVVGMLVGNRNLPPTGFVFTDLRFVLETLPSPPQP